MMYSVIMILLACVAQGSADDDLEENPSANKLDKLIDRALKARQRHLAFLDSTMLGKASHLAGAASKCVRPPRALHPHWRSRLGNVVSPLCSDRLHARMWVPSGRHVRAAAAKDINNPYEVIRAVQVVDPRDGSMAPALEGLGPRCLFVVMPQLGDFDSAEYAEQIAAVLSALADAKLDLRIVGIGDAGSARRFADFSGLPLAALRIDPDGVLHRALALHAGPGWELPDFVPEKPALTGWLNYLAMCAGIGSPGTLREILRGYIGDRSAPERLRPGSRVTAGPVSIDGTQAWRIGPIGADLWWSEEKGYQRPVELATVRLRVMSEVLGNFNEYVKNNAQVAQRGATFVFENGKTVYEWRDRGVLQYSETMTRPLSFLMPYIGPLALNPLELGDPGLR
eukprot:gnl/TRDRNA2_/TRDRNA2_161565_c1_seq3.p1 gnl/TRDRNA2_/TRDRNA2_161565_c1~~gnl/TRDRNA2_/TRDRNA2_161565_c1_seq3.p1  ORF type:complete len:397 (-),score=49.81 gnl/TRDRNA2_/TRDRNA2_161565_c1_seq3:5-1195(-)